jgi:hypothetical protein
MIRIAVLGTHATLVLFLLFFAYFSNRKHTLLIVHCISALLALLYVPPSIWFWRTHRESRFDQARGEIGYVAIQSLIWFGMSAVCPHSHSPLLAGLQQIVVADIPSC